MPYGEKEGESDSGILENYRTVERAAWVKVALGADAVAAARVATYRWRESLEELGGNVLWTRCTVEEEQQGDDGRTRALVWMIAGVEKPVEE